MVRSCAPKLLYPTRHISYTNVTKVDNYRVTALLYKYNKYKINRRQHEYLTFNRTTKKTIACTN